MAARLDLKLRLPNVQVKNRGKKKSRQQKKEDEYVRIKGLHFEHGHKQLLDALGSETRTSVPGKRIVIHSVALAWRFVRKEVKGQVRWYVHVTLDVAGPALITDGEKGAIGVDFNSAHVDLGERDASGNPVGYERIGMYLRGRRAGQRTAIIGDTVKEIVERARESQKPVVIENLEFSGKKAKLEGVSPGRARTLTSLTYRKFEEMLRAACFRAGVEVREVNPAWTSLIGTFQYAQPLGISSHEAAAIVIARRSRHFSEEPRASAMRNGTWVPVRNGGHVAVSLPERNRETPLWSFWAEARKNLRAALKAHHRRGARKGDPPPPPRPLREKGAAFSGGCG